MSLAVAAVIGVSAAPARADGAPGACLLVQNHSGYDTSIRLNYPYGYSGTWDFSPGEIAFLADGDRITSSTGSFNVQMADGISDAWAWDPMAGNDGGCNGSWVLTLN
ncbi:hypothetical protein [Nocardia sp. NPDC056000]|uniref:hypothetical protein n=1 Tax=Nocardia sp. NPDC056000 TaxID=3345674 RepID=UPI0035DA6E36